MQHICAIVPPVTAREICDALRRFGRPGVTVSQVASADARGHAEVYRGSRVTAGLGSRTRVDIVASDADSRDLVELIRSVASRSRLGGTTIWTDRVVQLARIRTGERGLDAL